MLMSDAYANDTKSNDKSSKSAIIVKKNSKNVKKKINKSVKRKAVSKRKSNAPSIAFLTSDEMFSKVYEGMPEAKTF